jgi:hypothetical protein
LWGQFTIWAPAVSDFGGTPGNSCASCVKQALKFKGSEMSLGTILLIILVILLIGALPSWPYSAGWGRAPAGILGVILIVLLVLVLFGRV